MKKTLFFCIALLIAMIPAMAEDTITIAGSYFTCEVPADWEIEYGDGNCTSYAALCDATVEYVELYSEGLSRNTDAAVKDILYDLIDADADKITISDADCKSGSGTVGFYRESYNEGAPCSFYFVAARGDYMFILGGKWAFSTEFMRELTDVIHSVDFIGDSAADFDFSAMSLAELIDVRNMIQSAMWESGEWQSVEVPPAVYKIGEDIPAGHWTITATGYLNLFWGEAIDKYGVDVEKTIEMLLLDEGESVSWNLVEGTYLKVGTKSVIFTPYAGKPNLNFR